MKTKLYRHLVKMSILTIFLFPLFLSAQIILNPDGNSPSSMQFDEGNQPTVSSFFQDYRQDYPLSAENQIEAYRVTSDQIGTHHRYNQYYKGVEILGAQFVLHEKNGMVWYANGHLVHGLDLNVSPALSEETALRAALSHIDAVSYMWENPGNETFLKNEQNDREATFYPEGVVKLTSGTDDLMAENIRLVYRFDIYAEQPLGRYWVDVDAKTGDIVNRLSRIQDADVPGSGASQYNGPVSMIVDEVNPTSYRLQENTTRGAAIRTFDMLNGTNYGAAVDITSALATGPWDAVGVSAHWGAEATYDYYLNKHGRNSLDDAGFPLLSYVHRSVNYNNAYWDGSRMTYGDGDGVNFTPLVSLDVVSHELTHGVTNFSSNLIYYGESGALNESFSDIFGNLVEFEEEGAPGTGTGSWRMGEDITPSGLGIRNMSIPNEFNDPDTYYGDHWASTSGPDNGGVHTNSGVQNFWFYLLSSGGSGTNDNGDAYSVTGIGLDDAAAIAYHNNTSFLIASSNYNDARVGSIACAEALFGEGSQQAISTADAWDAVGVYSIEVPENDLCEDAIAMECNTTESGSTANATLEILPACGTSITAPGVWYTVVGHGANITASTCNAADYDTKISVFEGSCESLVCVGGLDDSFPQCGGFTTEYTWPSTIGTTYYILVHGFLSQVGTFDLTVTCEVPAAITVSPTEMSFVVPLDGNASDLLSISNTGDPGAVNLDWLATKQDVVPALNLGPTGPVYKLPVYDPSDQVEFEQTFKITDQTLEALRTQNLSSTVINSLEGMINITFEDKEDFAERINLSVGEELPKSIQKLIMENAVEWREPVSVLTEEKKESKYEQQEEHEQSGDPGIILSAGGPDAYGYQYIDSDEAGGPVFDWVDITGDGTQLILGDDASQLITLPFSFMFYGIVHTDISVSSNGYLTFGSDGVNFSNDPIPHLNSPDDIICPFWDDLDPSAGGTIHYLSSADQFIVQYTGLPRWLDPGTSVTFQVILNSNGTMLFQYLDMQGNTSSATVGIENSDASTGLQVVNNNTYVHDFLAVLIKEHCEWLSIDPRAGSIPQGGSQSAVVTMDATGLEIDTYSCNIVIASNAVNESQVTVPVTMIVGTPLERIEALIAKVEALEDAGVLNKGQANALIAKLKAAKKSIENGNINAAINQLYAFINQVNAFMNSGILTEAQGNELIEDALAIIELLQNNSGSSPESTVLKNDEVGSGEIQAEGIELINNFPNPFSETTTIEFVLEESNQTTLKVYSMIGEEVVTLFDNHAEAGRRYTLIFEGNHLPGGVYFYYLKSGDNVNIMNRMMLIK